MSLFIVQVPQNSMARAWMEWQYCLECDVIHANPLLEFFRIRQQWDAEQTFGIHHHNNNAQLRIKP